MTGTRINGFLVGEWLGNGRAGSLFLSRHETTGQVAVVRLVTVNKVIKTKYFLEEALMLMPEVPDLSVIEVTSMEGATVQFAMTPVQASAGVSSRRMVALAALALLVAALVFVFLDWSRRAPAPTVVTTAAPALASKATTAAVEPVPPSPPSPASIDAAVAPEAVRAAVVKAEVPRPPPSRAPTPPAQPKAPACVFDDRFRDYARRTRLALQEMADPSLSEFQALDDRLTDALVAKDCGRTNEALNRMRRFVRAPVD